jgi:lipopolysaccharide/colanic/teichoic acid biosynthesis glycosyltransferase
MDKNEEVKGFLSRRNIFNSVHTKDQFQRILERERALSDRKGHGFSLIVFSFRKHYMFNPLLFQFINKLKSRIRSSDIIGWLDAQRLGILLADTDNGNAAALAQTIQTSMPAAEFDYTIVIYTYPDDGIPCKVKTAKSGGDFSEDKQLRFSQYIGRKIPLWKRSMDILGASFALIALFPVMILIPVLIKSLSKGPIVFRQERLGYLGTTFICYKFRTMHININPEKHKAHLAGLIHSKQVLNKIDDGPDSGIIPFGNVLRKLGLDELPQLLNVLKGDMSLIGPRPCMIYEAVEFSSWQHRRFDIHPGLTGLWQVSGKNRTTFEEMMRLDINYGKRRSLFRDFIIIIKTLPAVIRQLAEPKPAK